MTFTDDAGLGRDYDHPGGWRQRLPAIVHVHPQCRGRSRRSGAGHHRCHRRGNSFLGHPGHRRKRLLGRHCGDDRNGQFFEWALASQILVATAKANCVAAGAAPPLIGIADSHSDAAGQYINVWETSSSTSFTIGADAAPADGVAYYLGGTAGNIYPAGDGGLTAGLENIFLGLGDGVSQIIPISSISTFTGVDA